jgi:MSHA biogenesis protein MshO
VTTRVQDVREAAFTLVELVVTLSLTAILSVLFVSFLLQPMQALEDVTQRSSLVHEADLALRRLARDVRAALPNSLRTSPDGLTLELLHAIDGGRYREGAGINPGGADHSAASDRLGAGMDASFNVMGRLRHTGVAYGAALPAGSRLAIYTTTAEVWLDAAAGASPGVITPASTSIVVLDDGDEDQFSLSAPHAFRFRSPARRIHLVDGPVTYRCDLVNGRLERHEAYPVSAAQPVDPGGAPLSLGTSAPVAVRVSACRFAYDSGTATRAGLLTAELSLSSKGGTVRLVQQVHVENGP